MNNPLGSISYRSINIAVLLVIVCLLSIYTISKYDTLLPIVLKIVLYTESRISFLGVLTIVALIFSLVFIYEFKRNYLLLLNFNNKSAAYQNKMEDLYLELPKSISNTYLIKSIKEYGCKLLNNCDYESFISFYDLQRDIVGYISRMKDIEYTVGWNEERMFMNKLLELVNFCFDTSKFRLELFDPKANYRFPIGLFLVPLFNSIEFAVQNDDSTIKAECFTVDGLWNFQISNYVMPLVRSRTKFKYKGFSFINACVNKGNWAISVNKLYVEQGMIVVIVGKDIN